MPKVVLLRHGESLWNKKNLFTGWVDVDLSPRGIRQAKQAGRLLKRRGFTFDLAYTSVLKRAIRTLWLALDEMDLMWLPIINAWQLNERHYGDLQGLNKIAVSKQFGDEQLHLWRRSFSLRPPNHAHLWRRKFHLKPPELAEDSLHNLYHDRRYRLFGLKNIPRTESLADTYKRTIPFWRKQIEPKILKKQKIIISASGNSLRSIVKYLDNISDKKIADIEIPYAKPLVYEFKIKGKKLIKTSSYYLK